MMYATTHNATMAINPLTGKQIWKADVDLPQVVFKYACCGILIGHGAPATPARGTCKCGGATIFTAAR